ncbi:hypothetical protein LCGC14_1172350 [marine sediment metagenome]|uniref:Uncharacterized protein n=1 Tax=marine sediment metagenome TaxID=412755 RepID=A0A0F9MCC1_9ZZZZ
MIELAHAVVVCPHFTLDGAQVEKTVVIGPIRIFEDFMEAGKKSYDLVIGCNRFRYCEDNHCAYSRVSRLERKGKTEPVKT